MKSWDSTIKRIALGLMLAAIMTLQLGPTVVQAAYNTPALFGPFSGDCTTSSSSSSVITCTKTNGTAFGTMSTQNAGAVNITGGQFNGGQIGNVTPGAGKFTTLQATSTFTATAGTIDGVTIGGTTPASGSFTTLSASGNVTFNGSETVNGGQVGKVTKVTTGASYTALATDYIIDVNKTTGSATAINLPSSPVDGETILVKDKKGDAATNNITITPASGTIDGAASYVENQGYQSVMLVYDGAAASWSIY